MNGEASISQRTGGLRKPPSMAPDSTVRTAFPGDAPRCGVKPTSCIAQKATTSVTPSIVARRMNGTPRLVACAMNPPATDPPSIAAPLTVCAWPKTASRLPSKCVARSASTSHASVAPEKNVNPRPRSADAAAHAQNGACQPHISMYRSVDTRSVAAPSRNENRRPRVSATTPVGTSKITCPNAKNPFAAKASVLDRPASSRNRVLMPQMNDVASVVRSVSSR